MKRKTGQKRRTYRKHVKQVKNVKHGKKRKTVYKK